MIKNPYRDLDRNPTPRKRLELGVFLLVVSLIIGAYQYKFRHRPAFAQLLVELGAGGFVISLIPPLGRLLYIGWMGLGLTLGLVTTPVIMFAIYLTLFVPMGLLFRIIGRDTMRRKLDRSAKSYWEIYPQDQRLERYFRQY